MEKERLESLLIDYIDGKLSDTDKVMVEQELLKEDVQQLYRQFREVMEVMDHAGNVEPSSRLRLSFDATLKEEIEKNKKVKTIRFQPAFYRAAAAIALLVIAGGIGFWIRQQKQQAAELQAMRQEMEATKLMLMTMLNNGQSASQRLQGANVAYTMKTTDDEIVKALVRTLNEDPNTNVRLAALDALSKFHEDPAVRSALIKSLSIQTDPSVQIALIQLMVTMKEKSIVHDLEDLVDDENTMKAVKDEAYKGLLKLT